MSASKNSQYRQNMRYFFASLIVVSLLGSVALVQSEQKKPAPPTAPSDGSLEATVFMSTLAASTHVKPPPLPVLSEVNKAPQQIVLGGSFENEQPMEKETAEVREMAKPKVVDSSIDPTSSLKKNGKAQDRLLEPLGGKTNSVRRRFSPF